MVAVGHFVVRVLSTLDIYFLISSTLLLMSVINILESDLITLLLFLQSNRLSCVRVRIEVYFGITPGEHLVWDSL